jgi:hypothetical protein
MMSNKNVGKIPQQKSTSSTGRTVNSISGSTIKPAKPASQLSSTPKNNPSATSSSVIKPQQGTQPQRKQPIAPEEEKKEVTKTGLYTAKPSAKFTSIKISDPFAPKNNLKNNSFAYVYNAGGIPCRIDHGTAINRLRWDSGVVLEELGFDPLLITCFEGLVETTHPFNFIAKQAVKELLESPGAADKIVPLLPRVIAPLRAALSNPNPAVFENALNMLKSLSDIVGDALNEHLNSLLGCLVKRMNDKKYKDSVMEVLHCVEENGGPSVVKVIKAKVPTYTNLN